MRRNALISIEAINKQVSTLCYYDLQTTFRDASGNKHSMLEIIRFLSECGSVS